MSGPLPGRLGCPHEWHVQCRKAAGDELLDTLAAAQSQPERLVRRWEGQFEGKEWAALALGQDELQQLADDVCLGREGEAVAVGRLLEALRAGEERSYHALAAGA